MGPEPPARTAEPGHGPRVGYGSLTPGRRRLLVALSVVGGWSTICGLAAAAAPTRQTAPGREVISVGGPVDLGASTGGYTDPAVALPDGGAAAIYAGVVGQSDLVRIEADGARDASFGTDGVVNLGAIVPRFNGIEVLRRSDGVLVIAGSQPVSRRAASPQVLLIGLNANGSRDQSFGKDGVAAVPIQSSCACSTVGLRPGGGFVVDGATAQQQGPTAYGVKTQIRQWTVAGLTADGDLDPSFGAAGFVMLAGSNAFGMDLRVMPDGDIVADGELPGYAGALARLLPSGVPDPSFAGGMLETLPLAPNPGELLAYPDGTAIIGLADEILRSTTTGLVDQTFGTRGSVEIPRPVEGPETAQILPAPGDGALVIAATGYYDAEGRYRVELIGPTGMIEPSLGGPHGLVFATPFGGGNSSVLMTPGRDYVTSADQNTFAGSAVRRPDGSYLFLGNVTIFDPTTETGASRVEFAATALTPAFTVDRSFGGPAAALRATVEIDRQSASSARTRHGIRVTVNLTAAGLVRIQIDNPAGRLVARNTLPVFNAGDTALPVELTRFGATWLTLHPCGRLTARLRARDLLADDTTASAEARLR